MVQERSIEGVGDGMVEGGAALGMGIYRGFTGLVTKPVEGAKSKGVGGIHCLCCSTKIPCSLQVSCKHLQQPAGYDHPIATWSSSVCFGSRR